MKGQSAFHFLFLMHGLSFGFSIMLSLTTFFLHRSAGWLLSSSSSRCVRSTHRTFLRRQSVSTAMTHSKDDITTLQQQPPLPKLTIFYNDVYEVTLPPNHRFPMEKYGKVRRRIQEHVRTAQGKTTAPSKRVDCEFKVSPLATFEELATTHCPLYIQRYLSGDMTEAEQRNVGFPWSPAGVNRSLSSVGGTVAAARCVAQAKAANNVSTNPSTGNQPLQRPQRRSLPPTWAAHVAGGTHHAFYDYGEGFCVWSDIAVAANVVLQEYPQTIKRILIIDLDVHQGNGNAVLFADKPNVITFSIQCEANYFSPKEKSDLDIELPVNTRDETYLLTLRHWLSRIAHEAGDIDLVFFQAGVDGLADDRLGRLALTEQGLERRNELVYDFCDRQDLPLVITMGGGYPRLDWEPILAAHTRVYTKAYDFLAERANASCEAGYFGVADA